MNATLKVLTLIWLALGGVLASAAPSGVSATFIQPITEVATFDYDALNQTRIVYDEVSLTESIGYDGALMPSTAAPSVCRELIATFAPTSRLLAAKNVVYRELSAADRAALEAGQPLVPKGTGGTILDHVRGEATGHISASRTVGGTARFNGGNGLVEIDVNAATSGGTRFIPHSEVLEGVGARPKQIQKVLESGEVMFEGPIPPNAVRPAR